MKIAIPTDSGQVAQHFGRCPRFTLVDIEDNQIKRQETIDNPGHKPGYIPQFLQEQGVDCVITGGMGRKAISHFDQYGIEVRTGVEGELAAVIDKFIRQELDSEGNLCSPGQGKGYGVEKEDRHHH